MTDCADLTLPSWSSALAELPWCCGVAHGVDVPELRVAQWDRLGIVLLHAPRTINALTLPMVQAMLAQLQAWATDDGIDAVAVVGAGERGLCSGGDIKKVREAIVESPDNPAGAVGFWRAEYVLDAATATYPKPYVAFMDGVTMGGGLGISSHGSLRLATDTTRCAMPETIIGFFPDVGVMHELGRMPGQMGMHLALTGASIDGADAVRLGLADVLVPRARLDEALRLLASGDVDGVRGLASPVAEADASSVLAGQGWIDACYTGTDVAAMVARLEERPEPVAREAAQAIRARSPWALTVGAEALRRAQQAGNVVDVLKQDAHLAAGFMGHPDFREGVRALLVDKDKSPQWTPARLEDVDVPAALALFDGGPLPAVS